MEEDSSGATCTGLVGSRQAGSLLLPWKLGFEDGKRCLQMIFRSYAPLSAL